MPTTHDPSAPAPRRPLGHGPGTAPPPEPEPAPDADAPPEPVAPEPESEPGPEEAQGAEPEAEPDSDPEEARQAAPEEARQAAPEEAAGSGPEAGPEVERAAGLVAAPNAGSEEAREAGPEEATDRGPEAEPEADPEGATDAGPEGAALAQPSDATVAGDGKFTLHLENFEGPFDLLLQLISKHKLDVTEIALSQVTDEFMAHIRAMGPDWDLDQTTEFLVVAATLLDLKAARLLPAAEVEDEADLALLEARDLLFARLLQYRAYKQVADVFSRRLVDEARRYPRTVGLEPHHAELLPEVVISIGAEGFAKLAVKAMQPKAKPQVYVDHIHAPLVSVREQAEVVVARLRAAGEVPVSFQELTEDAPDTLTVVARFLALLELYRERAVVLDQPEALGELTVRWAGTADGSEPVVTDEFDRPPEPPAEGKTKQETEAETETGTA